MFTQTLNTDRLSQTVGNMQGISFAESLMHKKFENSKFFNAPGSCTSRNSNASQKNSDMKFNIDFNHQNLMNQPTKKLSLTPRSKSNS